MIHLDECNCPVCHQNHIDKDEVLLNWKYADFKCCFDEVERWIEDGTFCPTCESWLYIRDGHCSNCMEEPIHEVSIN